MTVRFLTAALVALVALPATAQSTTRDTLRHIPPGAAMALPEAGTGASQWGYTTGHNYRYTEEFAEKYVVSGPAQLVGAVVHVAGNASATPGRVYGVRAFWVGANNLPGNLLTSRTFAASTLNLSGPTVVMLTAPVSVPDSFYVSFNLGDYAHGGDANLIGLMTGARAAGDTTPGRNAVRQHTHGAASWRDMATTNVPALVAHLAVFPIVEFSSVSAEPGAIASGALRVGAPAPHPAAHATTLAIETARPGTLAVTLYDALGREARRFDLGERAAGSHTAALDVAALAPGLYVAVVEGAGARVAVRLTVAR